MENTITYKCPNCEAGLLFDAAKGRFVCEFCLSDFAESELNTEEEKIKTAEREAADRDFDGHVREYYCASCGAEVISEENTIAGECYYCHNPIVIREGISGGLRPDKIIPFKIDREAAEATFLAYAKKKWFVPNNYFSPENISKLTGIYYPFWVTDADTDANLDASAKIIRKWSDSNYNYTEVSRYRVTRSGAIHFEDITSSAISEEDRAMLEGILPYPSDCHIDFSIPYLQGFVAKKRNMERDALAESVRNRMTGYAETLLRDTAKGYTTIETNAVDVKINKSHWQYTLMPIWILNYKKQDKNYTYAMNGYTGKLYGELPISIFKLSGLGLALFTVITAILSFFGYLLFM